MIQLQQSTFGKMEFIYRVLGTNILSSNFIKFANSFLVDNDNNRFRQIRHHITISYQTSHHIIINIISHQPNDLKSESDLEGLTNLRNAYQNSPLIAYLNINSLREKIIRLRIQRRLIFVIIMCCYRLRL